MLRASGVALQRQQPAFDAQRLGIILALLPVRPLDFRDDRVDKMQRTVEIAELGHALGEHGSTIGIAYPTTALLPDDDALLEQSHPFGGLALPDQCNSRRVRCQALRQEGQTVFATQSLDLCGAVKLPLVLTKMIEDE